MSTTMPATVHQKMKQDVNPNYQLDHHPNEDPSSYKQLREDFVGSSVVAPRLLPEIHLRQSNAAPQAQKDEDRRNGENKQSDNQVHVVRRPVGIVPSNGCGHEEEWEEEVARCAL